MRYDLAEYGTEERPLRCSGLGSLVGCPWRTASVFVEELSGGEAGAAADTGSATHAAIEHLHKTEGATAAECIAAMQARQAEYPAADMRDAAAMFLGYFADPRNVGVRVVTCEEEVAFELPPAPHDPTGEAITILGHPDQVRVDKHGVHTCWDPKSSKKDPLTLLRKHQWQLAGYCLGASKLLGVPVHPGGLICTRRYLEQKNAFFHVPWTIDDIQEILLPVRLRVADIRAGNVHHVPNEDCTWCHFKSPDVCLPRLRKFKRALSLVHRDET